MRVWTVLVAMFAMLGLVAPGVSGQMTGPWLTAPPGSASARQQCPDAGAWLLLYWGGQPAPVREAASACGSADRVWASVGGRWLGYSPAQSQASDTWQFETGAAGFLHGGAGGTGPAVTLPGDYQWSNPAEAGRYRQAPWSVISTARLASLSGAGSVVEKTGEQCGGRQGEYLRVEGGLCAVGYFLEVTTSGAVQEIRSRDQLRAAFAPVQTPAEAVSFVGVTVPDLRVLSGDILDGHVLVDGSDFLVQVVRKNTFGCGSHEPTREIHRVTAAGEITRIAFEAQPPPQPGRPVLCVD